MDDLYWNLYIMIEENCSFLWVFLFELWFEEENKLSNYWLSESFDKIIICIVFLKKGGNEQLKTYIISVGVLDEFE